MQKPTRDGLGGPPLRADSLAGTESGSERGQAVVRSPGTGSRAQTARGTAVSPPATSTRRAESVYWDGVASAMPDLFHAVCDMDMEGIVAKRKDSHYRATEKPSMS